METTTNNSIRVKAASTRPANGTLELLQPGTTRIAAIYQLTENPRFAALSAFCEPGLIHFRLREEALAWARALLFQPVSEVLILLSKKLVTIIQIRNKDQNLTHSLSLR